MRKPVITLDEFNNQHMHLDHMLRRYRVSRRGRDVFNRKTKKHLSLRHAKSLKAINAVSRMAVVQELHEQTAALWGHEKVERIFFITLISERFSFTLEQATGFCTVEGNAWIKSIINEGDYIGFWEIAYYYRSPFMKAGQKPHVAWHAHLLVWNVAEADIAAMRDHVNGSERAFLPGRDAFHYRVLSQRTALGRIVYMTKGCLSEYTAYPLFQETIDPETGEIFKVPTTKWMNRKRPIRPGSLAKVTIAMGKRSLRSLCCARGAGKDLRSAAIKAARNALREQQAVRDAAIKRVLTQTDTKTVSS